MMPHSNNKYRELFRFFERLSFLFFLEEYLNRQHLLRVCKEKAYPKQIAERMKPYRSSERLLKMYLEKNKTAPCKNLFFTKILRYTYCKLIK